MRLLWHRKNKGVSIKVDGRREGQILYDLTFTWNLKKQKEKGHTQKQTVESLLPGAGAGAMGR